MEACASSPAKAAPLLLTALRFALTCGLDFYIANNFGALAVPAAITLFVILTDFFDGRLARRLGCPSRLGAILDVAADFFYIISFSTILWYEKIMPLWFILVIALNFLGFILTSRFLRQPAASGSPLVFDSVGRISAALFYIIPILLYSSDLLFPAAYRLLNPWILLLNSLLAAAAVTYRIVRCIAKKPG